MYFYSMSKHPSITVFPTLPIAPPIARYNVSLIFPDMAVSEVSPYTWYSIALSVTAVTYNFYSAEYVTPYTV